MRQGARSSGIENLAARLARIEEVLSSAATLDTGARIATQYDDALARSEVAIDTILARFEAKLEASRRAQEKMRHLLTAVEQASESIVIADADGAIQYVNPSFQRVTGYSAEEALGKNPRILKSGMQSKAFYEQMWSTLSTGEVWSGRFSNRRKDGSIYVEDATISPVLDEAGAVSSFIAVKKDVTRQLEQEAQALQSSKLESIGQLAAGIAHEINTPMQYIGDNTDFLGKAFGRLLEASDAHNALLEEARLRDFAPELTANITRTIKKAKVPLLTKRIPRALAATSEGVDSVAKIVLAMKEFSRPGTRQKQPSDINHAIRTTITVSRSEWKDVAHVETDFDEALPDVPMLAGEFNQALLNIVLNAAQAISDVHDRHELGTIRVSTSRVGDGVEVRVSDTGKGMTEEVQAKVFDPFFTTKEVGSGTGQGLAIARSTVVGKHEGTLTVESEVGRGSVFSIWLPLDAAA